MNPEVWLVRPRNVVGERELQPVVRISVSDESLKAVSELIRKTIDEEQENNGSMPQNGADMAFIAHLFNPQ